MNTSKPWDYGTVYAILADIYDDVAITLARVSEHKNGDDQLNTDLTLCCSDWKDKLTEIEKELENQL